MTNRRDTFDAQSLVTRVGQGDGDAENELVRRYSPMLRGILLLHYGDLEMVNDVVQETLIAAIENLRAGRLKKAVALDKYLLRIASNKANEYLRANYRTGLPVDVALLEGIDSGYDVLDTLADDELAEVVKEAIASLPQQRDRNLLWRFYYYDVDKAVLCRQFDISSAHFDRVNFRARERLRELVHKRVGWASGPTTFEYPL